MMKILYLDIEHRPHPFHGDYIVTVSGDVYSTKRGRPVKLSKWFTSDGYYRCKVNDKSTTIHRLVAETFLDKPKGCVQVNHIDGDKLNNHVSNLEWCEQLYNLHHAMDLGNHNMPRKRIKGTNVVTGEEIYFDSQADAARAGFTQPNISKVINGERKSCKGFTWEFVDE